jgi:hypothetical protein
MKDWAIAFIAAVAVSALTVWVSFSILPILNWVLR